MTDDNRLFALRAKLDKRRGMPGFEENVRDLEKEIERLEREGK